ncbi:MAG: acyltransferase [Caulobacter sp.]|jgi:peptidoglycan/LPS O-acetylase OafA/YrhL|nr:acyltransferase [Caulobacter sp.]
MTEAGPAPQPSAPGGGVRFDALDGWRGLCALWIVLYHFRAVSHVYDWLWVRTGDIAVDFFFVLSGFVIAHAYGDRLGGANARLQFLVRRFGRLYPLHIATLAIVFGLELGRYLVSLRTGAQLGRPAFSEDTSPLALGLNVLLVHAWGFLHNFTWNVPSWSISVEWALCLLTALLSVLRRPLLVAGVFATAGFLAIAWMSALPTFPFEGHSALARGVYGFFLGVIVYHLHRRLGDTALMKTGWLEWLAPVILALTVVFKHEQVFVVPPLLFAALVFIFASQSGPISRLLTWRPFAFFGEISYSIYLVHYVIVLVVFGGAVVLGGRLGFDPIVERGVHNASVINMPNLWIGDLASLAFLAATIGVSWCTYSLIEKPGRDWFNGLAKTAFPVAKAPSTQR